MNISAVCSSKLLILGLSATLRTLSTNDPSRRLLFAL